MYSGAIRIVASSDSAVLVAGNEVVVVCPVFGCETDGWVVAVPPPEGVGDAVPLHCALTVRRRLASAGSTDSPQATLTAIHFATYAQRASADGSQPAGSRSTRCASAETDKPAVVARTAASFRYLLRRAFDHANAPDSQASRSGTTAGFLMEVFFSPNSVALNPWGRSVRIGTPLSGSAAATEFGTLTINATPQTETSQRRGFMPRRAAQRHSRRRRLPSR